MDATALLRLQITRGEAVALVPFNDRRTVGRAPADAERREGSGPPRAAHHVTTVGDDARSRETEREGALPHTRHARAVRVPILGTHAA